MHCCTSSANILVRSPCSGCLELVVPGLPAIWVDCSSSHSLALIPVSECKQLIWYLVLAFFRCDVFFVHNQFNSYTIVQMFWLLQTMYWKSRNLHVMVVFPFFSPKYENNVAVRDRVAFACKFLNDAQVSLWLHI